MSRKGKKKLLSGETNYLVFWNELKRLYVCIVGNNKKKKKEETIFVELFVCNPQCSMRNQLT